MNVAAASRSSRADARSNSRRSFPAKARITSRVTPTRAAARPTSAAPAPHSSDGPNIRSSPVIASRPASWVIRIASWHPIASDSSAVFSPATPGWRTISLSTAGGQGSV